MASNRLIQRLKGFQTGEPLQPNFYRFLMVHTCFTVFTALPNVFINTFLMAQSDDIEPVMIYNAAFFFSTALGMFLASGVLRHTNAGLVSLVGILGYNLLYLQLILFGTRSADFAVLIGATSGFAGAFYWMSHSQRLNDNTTLNNRDSGLAILNIFISVVNLIVPTVSGVLITLIGGTNGYFAVFALAFVIAVATAIASVRLPSNGPAVHSRADYRGCLSVLRSSKALQFALVSEAFRGLREGVFGFILNVLLYQMIRNEALIGVNTFLSGGAAIASYVVITRMITAENRDRYMKFSVVVLLIFGVFTVFTMNAAILMVFTVVNSLFVGFLTNGAQVTIFDAFQVVPGAVERRPELFAFKELFLATGRCIGIFFFVVVTRLTGGSLVWQAAYLLVLTAAQLCTLWLSRRALSLIQQYHQLEVG